jgi:hypothetical protein
MNDRGLGQGHLPLDAIVMLAVFDAAPVQAIPATAVTVKL